MALQQLFADFARATGHRVTPTYNTVGAITDRFKGGEAADLLVLSPQALDALGDVLVSGSTTPVARAGLAVAIRQGAPVPDISTPAAFQSALLAARRISSATPRRAARGRRISQSCSSGSASPRR